MQKVKNILHGIKRKVVSEFVGRPERCTFLSSVIKTNRLSRINVPHVIELKFYGSFRELYPRERARVKGLLTRVWRIEAFSALESSLSCLAELPGTMYIPAISPCGFKR